MSDERDLDTKHYRAASATEDEGHDDGYQGRPDRTDEIDREMRHYYAGGYEQGVADRAAEAEQTDTPDPVAP